MTSIKTALSSRFFRRGNDFLGTRVPFLCGAMTWISEPNLVAKVSNAGGFGCLAGGNTPRDILANQIDETLGLTDKPFAVNLITIAPAYREHLELIKKLELGTIIFAGGFPRQDEIKLAKDTGAKVMCFASTESIATRMIDYGTDAIILEGMEAGGHVGRVSLSILLQQVLFQVAGDVPVFVAGGVASGKMCAHLFLMGAAGVQLGTRFAVAEESCAHPNFKRAFLQANARDAVSTPSFDSRLQVVPVRALRNKGHEEFNKLQLDLIRRIDQGLIDRHEAQMKVERFWMGALRRAVQDGDVEHGSLMAGQSVGLIRQIQTVREIIAELEHETEEELQRVRGTLC